MARTHAQIEGLAGRQHGVFSHSQLLEAGGNRWLVKRMVDAGRWIIMLPGVYRVASAPDTWEQQVMAACLWGGPRAVASHRCAARLWKLDGLERAAVEVTVPYGAFEQVGELLVHRTRRLEDRDRTVRGVIPVTGVERTLVDLCAVTDEEGLEIAMESAFRMLLTSMDRLWRRADALSGRPRLRTLRHLLSIRQIDPAHSRWEVKLLRLIREGGLPEPVRQHPVWDGEKWRKIDLAYPDLMIGLEYDSYTHHSGRQDWERTHTRFGRLTVIGWRILPVTMDDVHVQPMETLEKICLLRRVADAVG